MDGESSKHNGEPESLFHITQAGMRLSLDLTVI